MLKSQIREKILYFPLEIFVSSITQEYDNVTTPYYSISAQQLSVHWSLTEG